MLPAAGSVLGIDVGGSLTRRSTAVCRLSWTPRSVDWVIERSTAEPARRAATIARVAGGHDLLAAALDGPLTAGLQPTDAYRAAERMLTRGLGRLIGKPGQSNVPVGRLLNAQANACARDVLALGLLAAARHDQAIDAAAIVEAFPSSYLGLMLADPAGIAVQRGTRSDRYFELLAGNGLLADLLASLLPGRHAVTSVQALRNHDDRAALICALTALGLAAGDYCAVGDAQGWIVLPPLRFIAPWAQALLRANLVPGFGGCLITGNLGQPSLF
tara:strand:+ start:15436 stop:16254 length:819 start_codon:yes stop_codon:yes gene_type:complete